MKKLLFFIFSLLFIFAMVSCNIDSTDSTTPTGPDLYEGDLSSYVTLGEYKNLSITLESIEVTQDLITQRINNDFDSKKTSVDITRPIQNGDRLEIFFEGKNINKLSKQDLRQYPKQVQMVFQNPYSSLNQIGRAHV